jgi:hypothetical protein
MELPPAVFARVYPMNVKVAHGVWDTVLDVLLGKIPLAACEQVVIHLNNSYAPSK